MVYLGDDPKKGQFGSENARKRRLESQCCVFSSQLPLEKLELHPLGDTLAPCKYTKGKDKLKIILPER